MLRRLSDVSIQAAGNQVTEGAIAQRNFIGGLWHGAFLALGMALTQPTTIIAAFVAELTGSTVWVGGLSTVLTVAAALPQLFVARWVEPRRTKMPFLLLAIYLRTASWAVLAGLIYTLGANRPELLAWALVGLLAVFYAGGGLGNIPYTDIIGKVIPADRRGAFFGGKEALAAPLAVGAALLARQVLAGVDYPNSYALLFGLAAAGLAVASIGFWIIREPPRDGGAARPRPWNAYLAQLGSAAGRLKTLVVVQLLTGFSLGALPFYVVYARERLAAPPEAVGWFLFAQVTGGVLGNLLWARLVDRIGSRTMLTVCASGSALAPILAILLGSQGWAALLPTFFLVGAASNGRKVGFQSALLELAPAQERPTFAALNAVLILPIASLPLLAGLLLQQGSYTILFGLTAGFVAMGAVWSRRL
jgi:hypothetical protein